MKKNIKKMNSGEVTVLLLVVIFVFSLVMSPIIDYAVIETKVIRQNAYKEQALQIAEAGINYYQWHLAHFPTDYQDGTGAAGPYVHDYLDYNTQTVIGQYSLVITAPAAGSTIVKIESTGWTNEEPSVKKTVTARYGVPSLATYSFLSNDIIWIGSSESVNGQMHSNNGIHFDGSGNAPITSAKSTYNCPTSQGCSSPYQVKNGIWGSASQAVKNFWQFPVPNITFSIITTNIAQSKSDAQSAGIYLPPSNANGYSLVFNSNGTVSIYIVNTLTPTPTGAKDVNGATHDEYIDYGTRTLQSTKAIPANGAIFIEDKVWVEGTVHGRVMVTAAKLPIVSPAPTIYIPNNIVYTAKDGTDVLGLLAQKDIIVTYNAPSTLEIDAALIAQNGSTQFFNYSGTSATTAKKIKNSITVYGSIMSYGQWTWTWVNGSGTNISGYTNTASNYDDNLLYSPPPSFPISAEGYKQLSWTSK